MDIQSLTKSLGGTFAFGKGQAPCPICQPERRKDQNALSLSQQGDKLLLNCFKSSCAFEDILAEAHGHAPHLPQSAYRKPFVASAKERDNLVGKARKLWEASLPIQGTVAETYLRRRGIMCLLPQSLRFLPNIYHGPTGRWCCAMIADVQPTGGVHRTYFTKDGLRLKTSAKMMLGPCRGGAVTLSKGAGRLVVCEGIETGLSLAQMLTAKAPTVVAALSTSGMKNISLPEQAHDLIIGSDGDPAGTRAASHLAERATALGWSVSLLQAPKGQDWNDVLLAEVS
ncbi:MULTISPECIES: toprim domain-containing protein [Halocynthiibacter]|uniref:Toprim domain-containing protein n=1 Tax=Halocynthiibacter halioticoli TaxID=2986804 RepID=A0AAE3IZD8_9RHOB|nr:MULTISPECIES: toprim domain-containing protein [Halocynthiibacter]MCV6824890.1 toprim domain-containing protein [Halocynthiibacter halioticoli]MCW4057891.1 toprim domain-containing protein [Halocynthiibacter sp. SDUM655004]